MAMPPVAGIIYIPVEHMSEEERYRKILDAYSKAKGLAQYIKAPEVVIRPGKPGDFGLTGNQFVFSVSAGTNTIVDRTLDDDEAIVIYGFGNKTTSPQVVELKFKSGAETIADLHFENIYSQIRYEAFIIPPIIYSPKSRMIIEAIALGSSSEELYFKSFVVEKAGKNVVLPRF